MQRCKWCNINNSLYIKYHDNEWGELKTNDNYLFEIFLLETFQAGLSWECVLNKREAFRKAYDNFDIDKIINYDDIKINNLLNNKNIIRNKNKIKASINNAKIFKLIQKEYGNFYNYLCKFWNKTIIYENDKLTNNLSDSISKDLIKRGMKYTGSITIYAYLQAIGIINAHQIDCFKYKAIRYNNLYDKVYCK